MLKFSFTTCLVLFFCHSAVAQNESYQLFGDSVLYRIETDDYFVLKKRFLDIESQYKIDPSNEFLFLGLSVQNDDERFYKKRIKKLIKNNGLTYDFKDTLVENQKTIFLKEIYAKEKVAWLVKTSRKLHPKWVKRNPVAAEVKHEVEALAEMDQLAVRMLTPYAVKRNIPDSIKLELKTTLYKVGAQNINKLLSICERIGTFPNNFDYGLGSYYKIAVLIDHNLEAESNFRDTWEKLFPYLEKAYLEGKIDHFFLMSYDMHSSYHFGTQRFGFAPETIPVEEPEGFEERKAKYGL